MGGGFSPPIIFPPALDSSSRPVLHSPRTGATLPYYKNGVKEKEMSEDIQDNVDLKKKNSGFVLKIHRDIEGTRIYAKSEALHKLLSMFANGKKMEYSPGKHVWKYGNEYPDIVGSFAASTDIYNLLNNCKLDEGVEISFSRPVSRKYLEDLAKNIQKLVESTIQNYSSAIRISVNVEVSDPLIRWERNIPETVSRNSF